MTQFLRELEGELPDLRRFALRLCRNEPWSEDLLQETVCQALRLEERYTPGTNLRAWLFTLQKNCYLNERRKRQRVRLYGLEEVTNEVALCVLPLQETATTMNAVLEAAEALPEGQYQVLRCVSVDGLSYAETAQTLNIPVGTVRSRLARARLTLKSMFDE
jgi:RNA polymerase sigma-70 factor (ECF subfamily)